MTTTSENIKFSHSGADTHTSTEDERFQQHLDDNQNTIERMTSHMSRDEKNAAIRAAKYGYGPLAFLNFKNDTFNLPFGGEMQPGLFKSVKDRKIANPAPLGLCSFAYTTFLLSLVNLGTLDLTDHSVVIAPGYIYGGLTQILAGMWEMAIGNTFGATAFSSFGAFWISFSILSTPGGFQIQEMTIKNEGSEEMLLKMLGLFFLGWFIFCTLLLFCTMKSTVMFFLLFLTLDLCFLFVGVAHLYNDGSKPHTGLLRASGAFGIISSFAAWYNAYVGLADNTNSFVLIPAIYFPWTEQLQNKPQVLKGEQVA